MSCFASGEFWYEYYCLTQFWVSDLWSSFSPWIDLAGVISPMFQDPKTSDFTSQTSIWMSKSFNLFFQGVHVCQIFWVFFGIWLAIWLGCTRTVRLTQLPNHRLLRLKLAVLRTENTKSKKIEQASRKIRSILCALCMHSHCVSFLPCIGWQVFLIAFFLRHVCLSQQIDKSFRENPGFAMVQLYAASLSLCCK